MKNIIKMKQMMDEGTTLELEVPAGDYEGLYHCFFKGLEQGKICISPPVRLKYVVPLKIGDRVRVSLMLKHNLHRFDTNVHDILSVGNIVLSDPYDISETDFRSQVRIKADFPMKIRREECKSIDGNVMDISLGGLSFSAPCGFGRHDQLDVSFSLPRVEGGALKVEAGITLLDSRRIYINGDELCKVGAKFNRLEPEYERAILEHIKHKLERGRVTKFHQRSVNLAAHSVMAVAERENILTIWDRAERMHPLCGFGELGICCRNCVQGPCRIDPFGEGASEGICGAGAGVIVARNLLRMIAAGTAAHAEHARHLAHILLESPGGYEVKDVEKLKKVATNQNISEIYDSRAVGRLAMEGLSSYEYHENPWLAGLPEKRKNILRKLGVMPGAVDTMVSEIMHRTTMGVDANTENLLLAGLKCALADYVALKISTDTADILFGSPKLSVSKAGLGVLKNEAVNVAVHGHNPVLAEAICVAADLMKDEAIRAGASEGINIVGICCTGNEILMRRGIPLASNYVSQELVIVTGALDAVVIDYQCVMPSIRTTAESFHTKVITTMDTAKLEPSKSVEHIPFTPEDSAKTAASILKVAIAAFRQRGKVEIPHGENTVIAGFSTETLLEALSALSPKDPLKPLIDNIVAGNILGIALLCGCNNVNVPQDRNITALASELIQKDVLVLATGCAAGALATAGFMDPEAGLMYTGGKLRGVLAAVGESVGMAAIPPVLNMGSCVDNSRAVELAAAIADKLGVDISALPLVASAPELMSEKSVAIGMAAVALGIPVHVGVVPPVQGSQKVTDMLLNGMEALTGGYFVVETNPVSAADKLVEILRSKRKKLGI